MRTWEFLSGLFLICANNLLAQDSTSDFTYSRGASIEESVLPSSPQAASASRYFSSDIAYSTGAAQVSVPIYTLAGHELSVPIGLRYSSGSGIYAGGVYL